MDVESLAKQLILQNMTPEQQKAVLASIRDTVKQSKEVQKQKIGENVAVVVQALKKLEADIRSRYDEVGNTIEARVATIRDGRDGVDGVDGRQGRDGRDGMQGPMGPAGRDGLDGKDGIDGTDGVSVTDAKIDFDGSLIISLSNGREINVGEVVAADVAEKIRVVANGGGTSQTVIDTLASLQDQINNLSTLTYKGTWNASTNTPTLASSTGTKGDYYIVSVAGTTNLNGITDWQPGDWAIFSGAVWQKIDQSNLVSSVNGQVGAVVLGAADVGAISSVTSADASVTVSTVGTVADLTVYSAPRVLAQVRNETGATLTKGTVVYINGAAGNKATVTKALATTDSTSAQTFGLIFGDISNNQNGFVILVGEIIGLNTSAFTTGAQLYLSSTTAGEYTATKQYAPNHLVYIGVVTRSHATQGSIEVRIQNGYEMDELHNVAAQNPTNGQVLIYNETTSLWEKHTLTDGTGISITEGAGSITIANSGVTSLTGTTNEIDVSASTGVITLSLPATVSANITGTAANVTGTVAVANGGTGLTAGTSGGVLYYSATGTLASSAALVANRLVIGGGAGVAPSTTATGTGVVTALGVNVGTAGAVIVNGGVLGTPSSGTVTNLTGTASININGTVGATTPASGAFTSLSASGNLSFNSGFGSTAVAYGCRTWVNFNGTGTVAIRGSGNVTSITDNGVGIYVVNINNNMPDANFSAVASQSLDGYGIRVDSYTVTTVRVVTFTGTSAADAASVSVIITR